MPACPALSVIQSPYRSEEGLGVEEPTQPDTVGCCEVAGCPGCQLLIPTQYILVPAQQAVNLLDACAHDGHPQCRHLQVLQSIAEGMTKEHQAVVMQRLEEPEDALYSAIMTAKEMHRESQKVSWPECITEVWSNVVEEEPTVFVAMPLARASILSLMLRAPSSPSCSSSMDRLSSISSVFMRVACTSLQSKSWSSLQH